ncbi:acyltransferase family protein [Gimesia algae]|uniref:O-acetyltransferase OatA n=1 Tax=Gimesia algae TaxID=2527971 RepID=A0A517VCA1_9PLAN|nr:acyltransferase [Gimesia algae]QDT90634.1 O-acetyltransferase OatA [Gimesia algae]
MNVPPLKSVDSAKHVPALDGVRGVAILLVLFFHSGLIIVSGTGTAGQIYEIVSRSCWCGVDLFFVLSGFLITGILLDTRESPHYFRNFYLRRILRIFPLYYGVILWLFLQNPEFPDQIWYWLYLQNWGPVFGGSTPPMVVQPFWSLAVEEQFYLLWPFAVWLLGHRSLGVFCGSLFLLSLISRCVACYQGVDAMTVYTVTLFRLDTLSAGALIAVWLRNPVLESYLDRRALTGLIIVGSGLLTVIAVDHGFYIDGPASQTIGYSLFAVASALLIAVVVLKSTQSGILSRLLENPVLRYFGNRSYAIYIFQMMVLIPVRKVYLTYWNVTDASPIRSVLAFCASVLIILLLSEISWHCYEKQFLKLKRFFPREEPQEATPVVVESCAD